VVFSLFLDVCGFVVCFGIKVFILGVYFVIKMRSLGFDQNFEKT
jgi:hypothetical protein